MQLEVLVPQKNLADALALLPYTMMDSAIHSIHLYFFRKNKAIGI